MRYFIFPVQYHTIVQYGITYNTTLSHLSSYCTIVQLSIHRYRAKKTLKKNSLYKLYTCRAVKGQCHAIIIALYNAWCNTTFFILSGCCCCITSTLFHNRDYFLHSLLYTTFFILYGVVSLQPSIDYFFNMYTHCNAIYIYIYMHHLLHTLSVHHINNTSL